MTVKIQNSGVYGQYPIHHPLEGSEITFSNLISKWYSEIVSSDNDAFLNKIPVWSRQCGKSNILMGIIRREYNRRFGFRQNPTPPKTNINEFKMNMLSEVIRNECTKA